ncbi:protein N-terminal asparagine amidohydrolase [Pseudozyma hubeiensis SY62]|uniref:Protein N-terminal asparagine amidohydrolase n=1 Tax=Pseudozyma hubeiensis (strain SY62) TaxID=1305764 RepID=R9NVR8_PSEHS|nr:protein N-terminal asparagine amidohydrolase [Pseudozyma hubeiensis SY62]GAC92521.1 protein N-terminal asparagine amidohydrolase [Pseudozyma hubeiensis SY62]
MTTTAAAQRSERRRIACIQFDSKHADVAGNIETVLSLVNELIPKNDSESIDLVVLPELALTGYVFKDRDEIDPHLEDPCNFVPPAIPSPAQSASTFDAVCKASSASSQQPSLMLAAHLAQRLRCHVVIGFPELGSRQLSRDFAGVTTGPIDPPFDARPEDVQSSEARIESGADSDGQDCAFNSAALLTPDGSIKHIFRKHFLFETDEVWASEGSGFEAINLPGLGNVCVAICMDLNPFRFRTAFESCELASFCVEKEIDLLIMPMAWLLPNDEKDKLSEHDSSKPAPSLSTINYWAMRCLPFFDPEHPAARSSASSIQQRRVVYLVANNRTGTESDSTFAGSSCVLEMKSRQRPLLIDSLGASEQACLAATLPALETV